MPTLVQGGQKVNRTTASTASSVTFRSNPELNWDRTPNMFWAVKEIFGSDAYRVLSKSESDILMFVLSRRKYPPYNKKKNKRDYWKPVNGHEIELPYVAIKDFLSNDSTKCKPISDSTINRSLCKLMKVGFISLVSVGGNGKGDMSIYRIENNWRLWKKGDKACFTKAGMSRSKGFCRPGSGMFCPSLNDGQNQ